MPRSEDRAKRKQEKRDKQRARLDAIPKPEKKPKFTVNPDDVSKTGVHFSFELYDSQPDWREQKDGNHATFNDIAQCLSNFSKRTWGDIEQNQKHDHACDRTSLCKEAQNRIAELKLDDFESFWRFRFDGTRRLWGIRDGHVLRVLWWDPDHQVYPSTLKHT